MHNLEDNNNNSLTELDSQRLQDLENDEEFVLESGKYKVCHYGNTLVVLGMDKKGIYKEFKNKELVLSFLAKN
jgi:hypothetical protein